MIKDSRRPMSRVGYVCTTLAAYAVFSLVAGFVGMAWLVQLVGAIVGAVVLVRMAHRDDRWVEGQVQQMRDTVRNIGPVARGVDRPEAQ